MRFVSPSPPTDPEAVRAAWDEFVRSGLIHPDRVRPFIARAWVRSSAGGCDPRQARANALSAEDTITLIRREGRLVEVATPFLAALSRAAGQERHAAMLGDASGRVLKIVGDPQTVADENFPRAGTLLSEEVAGANGIGTALAEGGYVELVGPEHFIEGFHVFTCQGVPLAGSDDRPVGVMSMSVRREETASRVRDILFCASEAAACELLSQHLTDTIAAPAPIEQVAEKLRQDIVQRLTMARLQFELAARQIARGSTATETLQAAQELVRKFRRQAAVWRNLVDHGTLAAEPVALTDLVEEFLALLETEARVAQTRLVWGRAEHCIVLEDASALSQRLLGAFVGAIQAAEPGSELAVQVVRRERVATVTIHRPGVAGPTVAATVTAPLIG
jgi:sigma-54 dependent transcriptional regulator, acetoin dehydrogenase operon transcriptional activator AcoR